MSPVKTIWSGQVEPEQDKKKNPGKPHGSGVFGHFEVSISAWRTAERDEQPSDRTKHLYGAFFLDITGFFAFSVVGCPIP